MSSPAMTLGNCHDRRWETIAQGSLSCTDAPKWADFDHVLSLSTGGTLTTSQPRALGTTESGPRTDERRVPFARACRHGSPFDNADWLPGLPEEYGRGGLDLGCEDVEHCLVAILPPRYTRWFPLNDAWDVTSPPSFSLQRTSLEGVVSSGLDSTAVLFQAATPCPRRVDAAQPPLNPELSRFGGPVNEPAGTSSQSARPLRVPDRRDKVLFGNTAFENLVKWVASKTVKAGGEADSSAGETETCARHGDFVEIIRRRIEAPRPHRCRRNHWASPWSPDAKRLWLGECAGGVNWRLHAGSIPLKHAGRRSTNSSEARKRTPHGASVNSSRGQRFIGPAQRRSGDQTPGVRTARVLGAFESQSASLKGASTVRALRCRAVCRSHFRPEPVRTAGFDGCVLHAGAADFAALLLDQKTGLTAMCGTIAIQPIDPLMNDDVQRPRRAPGSRTIEQVKSEVLPLRPGDSEEAKLHGNIFKRFGGDRGQRSVLFMARLVESPVPFAESPEDCGANRHGKHSRPVKSVIVLQGFRCGALIVSSGGSSPVFLPATSIFGAAGGTVEATEPYKVQNEHAC